MNNNFTVCVQSVCHHHAYMISDGRAVGQSQSRCLSFQNQLKFVSSVCAGYRCHKALFHTCIAA